MSSHFKKYIMFLLCMALLSAALFSHPDLIAEQAIPSDGENETVQIVEDKERSVDNHDQLDEIQENGRKQKSRPSENHGVKC